MAALSGNGFLRLVRAHALAEGFHFAILVADNPRAADAAVAALTEEASRLRGRPWRLNRLDPHQGRATPVPITRQELLDAVQDFLLPQDNPDGRADSLYVLDASRALPEDAPAWIVLFQRMNERRDAIVKRLAAPLVLCLPPLLELDFARFAPDFWSIRSVQAAVSVPVSVGDGGMETRLEAERAEPAPAPLYTDAGLAELRRQVKEARKRYLDSPEDVSSAQALAVLLDRLGEKEMTRCALQAAGEAYQEELDIRRRLAERNPDRLEWQRDLAANINKIGDIYQAQRELEQALATYTESLAISRRLVEHDPQRLEWQRNLAVSLEKVGDTYRAQGDLKQTLMAYQESLVIIRRLAERDPQRLEWLHDLCVSLDNVGDIHESLGDLGLALNAYQEAVEIARHLIERDPNRLKWQRDLIINLNGVGAVKLQQGILGEARQALVESLGIASRLAARNPDISILQLDEAYLRSQLSQLDAAEGRSSSA